MSQQQQPIYQLYESNIGIIVPMIKDTLDKAVREYPYLWIEHAVALAVKNNARSWRYVDAILRRWKVDGFDDSVRRVKGKQLPQRRDSVEAIRRYGEFDNT
jgi:DnaD/phage-associated family protein